MLESLLARPRTLIGGCVLAAAGVLAVHPTWARSLGADVWNLPALNDQVREAAAEDERLVNEDEGIRHRLAIKEAIVADLIAGRITLTEATDRFTELNAPHPESLSVIRNQFPGETDREKFARNVIAYALLRVEQPARSALAERLEAELPEVLSATAE